MALNSIGWNYLHSMMQPIQLKLKTVFTFFFLRGDVKINLRLT